MRPGSVRDSFVQAKLEEAVLTSSLTSGKFGAASRRVSGGNMPARRRHDKTARFLRRLWKSVEPAAH